MTETITGTWAALVASLRALPVAARVWLLAGAAALVFALAILAPVEVQDEGYHDFAPSGLFGWTDFGIVASNGAFLIVGVWGLWRLWGGGRLAPWPFRAPGEHWPYVAFFLGTVLLAFGSGYYHAGPTTETLLWDRLTMTVVFGALLAAFIADRIHLGAGVAVMLPALLILGALSMVYWRVTGDLRLYRVVQVLPVLLVWMTCLLFPGRVTRFKYAAWMTFWFGLATFCDLFDGAIHAAISLSGHSIKHLLAGVACYTILAMIQDAARRSETAPSPP